MQPRNSLSLWRAARDLYISVDRPVKLGAKVRFFLRSCLIYRTTRTWFSLLEQDDFAPLYAARPMLALKVERPYLTTMWTKNRGQKLRALVSHYENMRSSFSSQVLQKIYTEGVDIMHVVNTTTGRRLAVRFLYSNQFDREGELTLCLVDAGSGVQLVRLSFCLCGTAEEGRRVYIGGMQACSDERVRVIIHDLAKEMHGLRAKALALWCVQQLSEQWGVKEIYAIDDVHHVSNHHNRRHKIAASYDEFWAESDGTYDAATGFWTIPLQPRQKSREELKPNRRKQHERRYAFLGELRVSLVEALRQCEPGSVGPAGVVEHIYASPEKAVAVSAEVKADVDAEVDVVATEVSMAGLA